jgi:small subunit ribosomal protein S6
MAESAPLYDLTLVLSVEIDDERRAKIVSDVEAAITSAGGSIERHDAWGRRPLAFRIAHQAEGEYHLIQFHGPVSLLDSLSHTLRIDDGVLRFRVIKVLAGTPSAPDSPPPIASTPPPVPVGAAAAAPAAAVEIDDSSEE